MGVGLHFLSGSPADLGVPVRIDSAPAIGPGTYYVLLRQPAESLAADVFIMPSDRAVTAWLPRFRSRRPDLFAHPMGTRRITRILIHGPPAHRACILSAAGPNRLESRGCSRGRLSELVDLRTDSLRSAINLPARLSD